MSPTQVIGLDVGMKMTGVARGAMVARLAEPLHSVATTDLMNELKILVGRFKADTIVVGLPRSLNGQETAQTQWVRQWVAGAKRELELPFYWQDEALTSKIAEAEASIHKKPADSHALAAAILLQDFLDSKEADRNLA